MTHTSPESENKYSSAEQYNTGPLAKKLKGYDASFVAGAYDWLGKKIQAENRIPTQREVIKYLKMNSSIQIKSLQAHLGDSGQDIGQDRFSNQGVDGQPGGATYTAFVAETMKRFDIEIKRSPAMYGFMYDPTFVKWVLLEYTNGELGSSWQQINHAISRKYPGYSKKDKIKSLQFFLLEHDQVLSGKNDGIDGGFGKGTKGALDGFLNTGNTGGRDFEPYQFLSGVIEELNVEIDEYNEVIGVVSETKLEIKRELQDVMEINIHNKLERNKTNNVNGDSMIDKKIDTKNASSVDISYTTLQAESSKKFNFITGADATGLAFYESYFQTRGKSETGSKGVMQLTSRPFRELLLPERRHLFDLQYLKKYVFDMPEATDEELFTELATYGSNGKITNWKKLNALYYNSSKNIAFGVAYLQVCESNTPLISKFKSWINVLSNNKKYMKNKAIKSLNGRGIQVDEEKMDTLLARFDHDISLQRKYLAFAKYNGQGNGGPSTGDHKFTYALCVLYLGAHVFGNESVQTGNTSQ